MSNSGIWGWFCAAVVIVVTVVMIYTGVFKVTIYDKELVKIDESNQTIKIDVVDDGITIDSTTGDTVSGLEGVDDTLSKVLIQGVSGYSSMSTNNQVAMDANNYFIAQIWTNYTEFATTRPNNNTSALYAIWGDRCMYEGTLMSLSRYDYHLASDGTLTPRRTDLLYDISNINGIVLLYAASYSGDNKMLECNNPNDDYMSVSNTSVVKLDNTYYKITYDDYLAYASVVVKSLLLNDDCTDNSVVHGSKLYLNNLVDSITQYDSSSKSWVDCDANFVANYQYGHACYWDSTYTMYTYGLLVVLANSGNYVWLNIEY